MLSRSASKELPPRAALGRSSSTDSHSSTTSSTAESVDIDTLMLTINNAVAKIASIRESFEDGRPPRHSTTSSYRGKSRMKASSASSSTFDDMLRFSGKSSTFDDSFRFSGRSTGDDGKPPLARGSSGHSFNSSGSSPSMMDRRSSKNHHQSFLDDASETSSSRGVSSGDHGDDHDEDTVAPDLHAPSSGSAARKAKTKLPFPYHKLQSTTSIDLDDNLTPFKELRLARLQDIKVQFHNGLPQEFYAAIARFLQTTLEVKRRFHKLKHLKECFLGCDAFDALLDHGFATDENEALLIGNVLLKLNFIEDITAPVAATSPAASVRIKNRNDGFYRFTKPLEEEVARASTASGRRSSATSESTSRASLMSMDGIDFADASDEMHALISEESLAILARVLLRMFEKKNKLMTYKGHEGCFLGSELVTALQEMKIAMSPIDAILVGQSLLEEQLILPIQPDTTDFQSKYTMYRLANL
ncbi:Aste57867_24702 [Aphanomyces stellatus]|uniref:Aste57867_24702 protein n=1 Tax=Aphanomyces stellatus TaxID=120398 RepID=A0A485LRS8_9STRA|nr:hypothetical protein As57867_024624 [Aphanomyces stellatus]VFU01339.1 Aste57867_24702 [Aphanomyces stellatus]